VILPVVPEVDSCSTAKSGELKRLAWSLNVLSFRKQMFFSDSGDCLCGLTINLKKNKRRIKRTRRTSRKVTDTL
jgi:hypothetical protein